MQNDNYQEGVNEGMADIVVFKKGGNIVHSAKKNKDGTYNNDAGILKTEYHKSLGEASRGLTDVSNKNNLDFAKKKSPNKKLDTNLGKVGKDGTRTISDPKEIRQFLNQLQGK